MKSAVPVLLILLSAGPLPAEDKSPAIRFPQAPAVPQVMPPRPATDLSRLAADQVYVIDSDVPLLVFAVPDGVVTVSKDLGPVKVRGKFVDGQGRTETREFKGKHVVTVEAAHSGKVELLVFPTGATAEKDAVRKTLDVDAGEGPRPPPTPVDPVVPDPPKPVPSTNPFDTAVGLHVMIVFDSTNTTRPAAENSVLYGKAVQEYLNLKCAVAPGLTNSSGQQLREWNIWPLNSDVSKARQKWAAAFTKAKADGGGKDWVLIGNGDKGYSGPLPKTEADALKLLKQYGGE